MKKELFRKFQFPFELLHLIFFQQGEPEAPQTPEIHENVTLPALTADEMVRIVQDAAEQAYNTAMERARERHVQRILSNPEEVARRAALTRKYLNKNHLTIEDTGLVLKPDDFNDDVKLVRAVLNLQHRVGLPLRDRSNAQDGTLGEKSYQLALKQGLAKESFMARLRRLPEEAAGAYKEAVAAAGKKAQERIAQLRGNEVLSILNGQFNQDPLFKALMRVYQGIINQEERKTFLRQAAEDLTDRLAQAPDMTNDLRNSVLTIYLNAIANSPMYPDKDRAEWVASALDASRNRVAFPETEQPETSRIAQL